MLTLSHATLQLQPTKTTCPLPVLRVENPPPMLLSAAPQVPVESSEPLSLKDAKAEDILKGLQAMSPEDRKKVEDALKIVEKDMMAKVARIYKCSSGNGDWGDYEMQVNLKPDASGHVKEQTVMFRDSPEETETWYGTWQIRGDIVTFTGTELEKETSGAGGVHKSPKEAGRKEFKYKVLDGALVQVGGPENEELDLPFKDGKKKTLT
eukprot:symbB.v1.2.022905.t1/scaffold2053.1/size90990/5